MRLTTPVNSIPFIGAIYAKRLQKLGIATAGDLLHHYPFRYDDYSLISPISHIQEGETVTVQGSIEEIRNEFTKYGKNMQKAVISDGSGTIQAVWFNQPFLVQSLHKGIQVSLSGMVKFFRGQKSLQSPEYEVIRRHPELVSGSINKRDQMLNQAIVLSDSERIQNDNNRDIQQFITIHTGRLVPVYPETYGVSSKWLRSRIRWLLEKFDSELVDYLPDELRREYLLSDFALSIRQIHFPDTNESADRARERLAFDELFLTQLASQIRKRAWRKEKVGVKLQITNYELRITEFIKNLPFKLTAAQQRCVEEILSDLGKETPMNRLLQGDVGSGKTVVAAIAMYIAHLNGYRSVIMAPTEILAQQHYETLKGLFEAYSISLQLITSSTKQNHKSEIIPRSGIWLRQINHKSEILIGTHALLFKEKIDKLALVIIDEQHRFGVAQRAKLKEKGLHPHLLSMTATPIPRSAALVLHSELDLSYIDEMPHGRKLVKTWLVPNEKREAAYEWMRKQLTGLKLEIRNSNVDNEMRSIDSLNRKEKIQTSNNQHIELQHQTSNVKHQTSKNQAFIICPLIEESDHESMQSVKAATAEYERLQRDVFPDLKLRLLHGRIKSGEKKKLLADFEAGSYDILVATPVVEVGIDIQNATIMLIEAAERFGLAQLHQLRGRVGRSDKQSYCLLFTESESEKARARLKNLERVHNGAQLAEFDLKVRGPGELYGMRQHGYSEFKLASLTDHSLIKKARSAADRIFDLDGRFDEKNYMSKLFPRLQDKVKTYIIESVTPD